MERDRAEEPRPRISVVEGLLWGIFTVSVILSICPWDPGGIPDGLYADEIFKLNQLRHLVETGGDMWGLSFPLYDHVYLYLAAPVAWVFGPTPAVLRTFSVLMIVAASLVFFRLTRCYGWDRRLSALAMVLFFLSPSLLAVKRLIMEVNALVLMLVVAWYFWFRALEKGTFWAHALGGLAWGGAVYAYTSARFLVVVFFGFFLAASWLKGGKHRRGIPISVIAFVVAVVPLLIQWLIFSGLLEGRYMEVSGLKKGIHGDLFTRAPLNYLKIVFSFLWFDGDSNLRHHFGPGGETYLAFLPLVVIGLWRSLRNWRDIKQVFLLWGLLVFPLPAIATLEPMHNLRTLHVLPFLVILAGQGADWLLTRGGNKPLKAMAVGLLSLSLLQGAGLLAYYTARYRTRANPYFYSGAFQAIERSRKKAGERRLLIHESLFIDETGYVELDEMNGHVIYAYGLLVPWRYDRGLDKYEKYVFQKEAGYEAGDLVVLMCPKMFLGRYKSLSAEDVEKVYKLNPADYRIIEHWPAGLRGAESLEWVFLLLEKKERRRS